MTDATEQARFAAREIIAHFESELGVSLQAMRHILEGVGETCFMRGMTAGMERSQELLNEVLATGPEPTPQQLADRQLGEEIAATYRSKP